MKTQLKKKHTNVWEMGSREATLKVIHLIDKRYHSDCALGYGHKNAARIMIDAATKKPLIGKDGLVEVCFPWLLVDMFFPYKK